MLEGKGGRKDEKKPRQPAMNKTFYSEFPELITKKKEKRNVTATWKPADKRKNKIRHNI